jgi:hypothetical protein
VVVVVVVINAVIAVVFAVVAHGPGFAKDSCLLVHNSTSLGHFYQAHKSKALCLFTQDGFGGRMDRFCGKFTICKQF